MKFVLGVIVPVLNESKNLPILLKQLHEAQIVSTEKTVVVFVDGGSQDGSLDILRKSDAILIQEKTGRALQLEAGVRYLKEHYKVSIQYFVFLHADTRKIHPNILEELKQRTNKKAPQWGFASLYLDSKSFIFRLIGWSIRCRSRALKIATGDQMIFLHQTLLEEIGGVPLQSLMEDIEMTRRLRQIRRPLILNACVQASSRRWQKQGVLKTIILMWWLQICYKFGVSSEKLHRMYYR